MVFGFQSYNTELNSNYSLKITKNHQKNRLLKMTKSTLQLLPSNGRAEIYNLKTTMRCMLFLFDLSSDVSKEILPLGRLNAHCDVVGANKNA